MNASALLADLSGTLMIVAVFAVPLLIGLGVIFLFRRLAKAHARAVAAGPMTRPSGSQIGVAVFVLSLFALIGLAIFAVMFIRPVVRVVQARSWVAVPCVVESSRVASKSDSEGTTYRPEILYTYRYGKLDYRGDRYDFMGGSSSGYAGKKSVVEQYPAGAQRECWVNPADPEDAVLNRGFVATMWFGLIPLVFVVIGVLGLVYTLRHRGKGAPVSAAAASPAPGEEGDSPRELRPEHSRLSKLLGVFAIAAFWNGISWTIFVSALRDREWFGVAFLTLFVLIGAALALAFVYQLLALANPVVHLTLRPGRLRRGRLQTLGWRLDGAAHRVRRLTITLEGRESATYTRGTSTSTDRSTFVRLVLAEAATTADIRGGETQFDLPEHVVPGFEGTHNKLQWFMRVQGAIALWPDLGEEFPVSVDGAAEPPASQPTTEAAQHPPKRSDDQSLALGVAGGRTAFAPGETLSGVAGWSLPTPPKSAEVRLFWYTQGKGTRDVEVVASQPFDAPQAGELRPFNFALPAGPWSVDGRLISLCWALELVVEPGGRNVRQDLVIAPGFTALRLPEAVPDDLAQPRWARWLKTGK